MQILNGAPSQTSFTAVRCIDVYWLGHARALAFWDGRLFHDAYDCRTARALSGVGADFCPGRDFADFPCDCGRKPVLGIGHNPVDVESGSDVSPCVEYIGGSAKLSSVPEPSSIVLLGAGIGMSLVCLRRRWR